MSEVNEVAAVVRPWYRQFYLRRGEAEWRSDQISDGGYEQGLEAVDGFVYVGTTMYGSPTEVVVRVHTSEPAMPQSAERTAEVTVEGAGDLSVLNWEPGDPPVAEVALPAGAVRLRVGWVGSAAAEAHPDFDLGGTEQSPEHLLLDIWPEGSRA